MNVLIACEESQTVCKAFRERVHNAFSCDIQECSGGHPEWHIKGDVLGIINPEFYESDLTFGKRFCTSDGKWHFIRGKWDLIIAHPPCTFITKAGARWMYKTKGVVDGERLKKALAAREFFMEIYNANCDRIAIENPRPLRIVNLPMHSCVVQPFEYGHPYSKLTLLWLVGLPPLKPISIINEHTPYVPSNTSNFAKGKKGSKGVAHSCKERSKTFQGIAEAMAEQWG